MNATGVFADELHRMDNPDSRPTIKPSQGVHLVLDRSFLQGSSAIMIPKTMMEGCYLPFPGMTG